MYFIFWYQRDHSVSASVMRRRSRLNERNKSLLFYSAGVWMYFTFLSLTFHKYTFHSSLLCVLTDPCLKVPLVQRDTGANDRGHRSSGSNLSTMSHFYYMQSTWISCFYIKSQSWCSNSDWHAMSATASEPTVTRSKVRAAGNSHIPPSFKCQCYGTFGVLWLCALHQCKIKQTNVCSSHQNSFIQHPWWIIYM